MQPIVTFLTDWISVSLQSEGDIPSSTKMLSPDSTVADIHAAKVALMVEREAKIAELAAQEPEVAAKIAKVDALKTVYIDKDVTPEDIQAFKDAAQGIEDQVLTP